jgi:hypothetical protein
MVRYLTRKKSFLTKVLLTCFTCGILFIFGAGITVACDVIRFQEIDLGGGATAQVYYTTCGNAAIYEDGNGHGSWQICNTAGNCVSGNF